MSGEVPVDPPKTREVDFAALVRRAWGDDYLKKEVVYKFGTREFKTSDDSTSGFYRPAG